MIELTDANFRTLIMLAGGSLALLVGMFVYLLRSARSSYLGDRWITAAGSYDRAAVELRRFDAETEALVVQHGSRFPPGILTRVDRRTVEFLIAVADRRESDRKFVGGFQVVDGAGTLTNSSNGMAPTTCRCGHDLVLHGGDSPARCRIQTCECEAFRQ